MKNSIYCLILSAFGFAGSIYNGNDLYLSGASLYFCGVAFICSSIEKVKDDE